MEPNNTKPYLLPPKRAYVPHAQQPNKTGNCGTAVLYLNDEDGNNLMASSRKIHKVNKKFSLIDLFSCFQKRVQHFHTSPPLKI
jgi:hypothetical protein